MNDRALLPPLRQQLSVANDALSILLGRFPAEWSPPEFDLNRLELPGELPVSLSSDLVHQRPDILASEASLHAASAAIGVATAQMYPSITLSGSVGLETFMTSGMSAATSEMWNIASGITAPIFEGGALVAQKQGAVDAFRGSLATYQQTVLQAFGQVADTLQALVHDADLVAATRKALDVADSALALQRLSYQAGKSDVLLLISPSGSTSKRDSAMPRRRPSGTRIRRSCSSPWGAVVDGRGSRPGRHVTRLTPERKEDDHDEVRPRGRHPGHGARDLAARPDSNVRRWRDVERAPVPSRSRNVRGRFRRPRDRRSRTARGRIGFGRRRRRRRRRQRQQVSARELRRIVRFDSGGVVARGRRRCQ